MLTKRRGPCNPMHPPGALCPFCNGHRIDEIMHPPPAPWAELLAGAFWFAAALAAVLLFALAVCGAPAPLPRPAPPLPPFSQANLIGTWQVRYNALDAVMTFDAAGAYRETFYGTNETRQLAGLWRWADGVIVISYTPVGDDSPVYVNRLRLDEQWSGRCLNYGVKVRFVRKRKQ
jgi:hypothetical protein